MRPALWLERLRSFVLPRPTPMVEAPRGPVVRPAPGIAALFAGIAEDRSHTVLDLGSAAGSSLDLYGGYARHVRFADLSATATEAPPWAAALDAIQSGADRAYDVLLLWDTLGRLSMEERPQLMARLAALSAPGARVHMVVESPDRTGARPLGFTLVDTGHMRYELAESDAPAPPRLFPSEVERVLAPFQVLRAFTLKDGFREYVAGIVPPPPPRAPRAGLAGKNSLSARKLGEFHPAQMPQKA